MNVRQIFILSLIVCHGLVHLIGFANAFGFQPGTLLQKRISVLAGLGWLSVALLFLVIAGLHLFHKSNWAPVALIGALVSQILIASAWKDARVGTIANAMIFILALIEMSNAHFNAMVNRESNKLLEGFDRNNQGIIAEADLQRLPGPVRKWLIRTGTPGKETIHFVRLKQEGRMRTAPGRRWMPFRAVQYFNADNPSFVWRATVDMLPGIKLQGVDKFSAGKGTMQIKLWSLIDMVNAKNDQKVDTATLTRYLAEIIWFPTAALSGYLNWEAIDSQTVNVTMQYHGLSCTAKFAFDKDGDLRRIEAERYKDSGKKATLQKWIVEISGYQTFNGFRIPSNTSVTWQTKEGDFTWAEMKLTDLQYNIYQLYR
jgi:hypothetical protein